MFQLTLFLLVLAHLAVTQQTVPDEDSCDLPWAIDCIDDMTLKLRIPNLPLEHYCSSTNYTINVCLKDILTADDCTKKYPRHGYYDQWRKPMTAALEKFCSITQGHFDHLNAAHCIQQSFFTCLQHDLNIIGPLGILEVITAQMIPEACSTLDLKVEECLQYDNGPECRLFIDTVLSLVQEFIESSTCKEQPAILVPLNTDESNDSLNDGKECTDELDFEVLGKCFGPVLARASNGQISEGLDHFCESSNETLHCLVDLLINGCTNLPPAYHDWLEILGIIEQGFCGSPKDFPTLHNCWKDYYECFHTSKGILVLADIFFNQITPDTCVILADEMETCLLYTDLECQNSLGDIITSLRTRLDQNGLCSYDNVEAANNSNLSSAPFIMILLIMIHKLF